MGGASEKGEATLNVDYPRGVRLLCCGNPPPEAPDCLSISLQNVYFFPHESLIRYLDEAHSSCPQRTAGDGFISPICHIGWLRVWPLPLHCLSRPPSGPPPSTPLDLAGVPNSPRWRLSQGDSRCPRLLLYSGPWFSQFATCGSWSPCEKRLGCPKQPLQTHT